MFCIAGLLRHSERSVTDDFMEEEDSPNRAHHDVHEDDMEFFPEEDISGEEDEDSGKQYKMCGPTPIMDLEAGIICGREHEFLMDMIQVLEATSPLTNMRILDKSHAQEIYTSLLKKMCISSLTLRPMSYYDAHLQAQVDFNVADGRNHFENVWKSWPEGGIEEEKLEKMMRTIMWEPCDGQHIVYACNVLAEEAFAAGEITEDKRNNIFRRRKAIPVVYNNPKMYIEMSKRQNDFHTPNRKETHAPAWQTLIKLRALWNEYGRPKPCEEEDVQRRWDMFICMAAVLNLKLDVQKTLNITKVSSKLYDWITHACREDDEAFEVLICLGQDIDAHILHQDPSKEVAWKKYLEKRNGDEKAKEPRHVSMSINWLKPLRGLHDEDFKELLNMVVYDHDRKRQRLYFHDVDKANPQRNTLEYVSMRLRQRYAVRNALRWLHIEGSTAMYKRMEDFMKIDITRFGEHGTLVALGQLGTRTFIDHWSSPMYVRVSRRSMRVKSQEL